MRIIDKLKRKFTFENNKHEKDTIPKNELIETNLEQTSTSSYKYNFRYLHDLIDSSHGKKIKLEYDIVLGDGEESEFPNGIMFMCSEFDGNGHTIDARGKTPIFDRVSGYGLSDYSECIANTGYYIY